ncbi:MAG: glycosyltransferase family 39 protein [Fimbriimonadaceae bacterium]
MSSSRYSSPPNWLIALIGVIPYFGFWLYGLTDLDEGFYGAVVTDMLRRGDWITPTYNGVPWFEKPILSYWLSMPFVSVMHNEFGARLPSFLCTLATGFVLFRFLSKWTQIQAGQLAVLVFSGNILVVAIGRMMMTDAALMLSLTLAITTFFESLHGEKKWRLVSAAMVGVGVLAKGPVAGLLFLGVIGLTYWQLRYLRPKFRGLWLPGLAICLVVIATWYVPAYLANGQFFIDKFLIEQNVGRFTGGDKAHSISEVLKNYAWIVRLLVNVLFFPLVVLIAAAPWFLSLRKAKSAITEHLVKTPEHDLKVYLQIWFLVIIGFFTLSGTKLPHYILPAMVPLSALIGWSLTEQIKGVFLLQRKHLILAGAWSVFMLILANYVFLTDYYRKYQPVQTAAKHAREEGREFAVYQPHLTNKKDQNGSLEMLPTSNPSLLFYYRKPLTFINAEEELDALKEKNPLVLSPRKIASDKLVPVEPYSGSNSDWNTWLYEIQD